MAVRTAGDARVALVTGGGRGIGQAISLKLASDGFDVALVYKADLGAAETVAERMRDIGQKALTLRSDMADPKAASDLGERTTAGLGRLDVLVGNAGQIVFKPFLETSVEDYDRQSDTNARGAFFTAQAAAKRMIEQGNGGRIVFITSDAAVRTYAGLSFTA
jgi:3-oxoacyl-[acyl-carrier protein] reductase